MNLRRNAGFSRQQVDLAKYGFCRLKSAFRFKAPTHVHFLEVRPADEPPPGGAQKKRCEASKLHTAEPKQTHS
jgi:hypothetical protein